MANLKLLLTISYAIEKGTRKRFAFEAKFRNQESDIGETSCRENRKKVQDNGMVSWGGQWF
jgi:hypothetical protein